MPRKKPQKHTPQAYVFFYLLLIIAFLATAWVIRPYISTMILALIAASLFQPTFEFLSYKIRHTSVATGVTILYIIFLVIIPLTIVSMLIFQQLQNINRDITPLANQSISLQQVSQSINQYLGTLPFSVVEVSPRQIQDWLISLAAPFRNSLYQTTLSIGSFTITFITHLIIFFIFVAALLPNYHKFLNWIKTTSPLHPDTDELFINRLINMGNSMVRGTFIVALVQALAALFSLWISGIPYLILWGLLLLITGFIPTGTSIITLPMALILIISGKIWQGIFMILFQVLVISNIDNYLRPMLVDKQATIPPTLLIVSLIGGLGFFGIFGFIFGPMVMILFLTTLEVYRKHFAPNKQ